MLKPNPKPTTLQPSPDDGRAASAVAFNALVTMLTQGSLPPDVMQHLKAAHTALLEHVTSTPTNPEDQNEGGAPLGESIAASKRRANGEDPDAKEDDGETDTAPRAKGTKPNPLGIKGWASSPTDDDDEPEKPKKKPAATVAKVGSKTKFLGRR